jgi:hypothetical protein
MSSSFIQVSPYLLLEYIYGDNTTEFYGSSFNYKPARLINKYDKSQRTFLNTNPARLSTQNVLDFTAANLGGVDWVILDKDVPLPYINIDSDNLIYEDLTSPTTWVTPNTENLSSLLIKYDKVRFHVQSGYNLDNIEGLLFQLSVREAQTDLFSYLASNVILKGTDRFIFNPNPVFITDRIYDRYIEIWIPSVKDANDNYYSNPGNRFSIGYQYTTDNRGYLKDTQIYVKAFEISSVTIKNGITYFKTDQTYDVTVRQEDIYSDVAAVIKESTQGDYFEYFCSYQDGFPTLLIQDLNSEGGNYVIIHQLDVIEQIDTRFITTYSFTQIQSGDFEGPLLYRPILRYAGISPSFSIEYTVRVYNTENGYQIVKKGSVTSFNPSKYGKNTEKISLSNVTSPLKVYNKVYGGAAMSYNPVLPTNNFNTVFVPVFYDSMSLYLGSTTVLAPGQDPLSPNFNSNSLYYSQGAARLYLGDFEQYVKFSLKQYSNRTNSLNNVDLSQLKLLIGFEDAAGKIFTYPALSSTIESPLSQGEVVFKIPAGAKTRIGLDGSNVKNFYILSNTSSSGDTKMYTGTVDSDINLSKEAQRVVDLGTQAVTVQQLISQNQSVSASVQTNSISVDLGVANQKTSITSQINNMTNASPKEGTQMEVLPPVIPGFTTDSNAASISVIKPTSE